MKKFLAKPVVHWVLVFIGYLAALAFLAVISVIYPIEQQRENLNKIAHDEAAKFSIGDNTFFENYTDVRKTVYDPSNNIIADANREFRWPMSIPDDTMAVYVSRTRTNGAQFYIYYEPSLNDLIAVSLETANVSGEVYVVSIIRNVKNLPEVVEGLAIGFTFIYIVFVVILIFWERKKKRLEILEKNYVANVTHSLKTPIASVRALTEALVDVVPCDSDQQQPYFGMILQATNTQSHMVTEILELSKLQSKGVVFEKQQVTANEIFGDVFNEYRSMCECISIPFAVDEAIAQLPPLYTDPTQLKQVMEILLENAMKYLDIDKPGGIQISVSSTKKEAVFCVYDDGSIISKEDLPNVFNQFYIGKNGTDKHGTGLGLAIAKNVLTSLKERIWIESEEGKGTKVYFTIKLK